MLSEIEDVEEKMARSFFNYQTIQLRSTFSEVTNDFRFLLFIALLKLRFIFVREFAFLKSQSEGPFVAS